VTSKISIEVEVFLNKALLAMYAPLRVGHHKTVDDVGVILCNSEVPILPKTNSCSSTTTFTKLIQQTKA
jgi:hypothetical protein